VGSGALSVRLRAPSGGAGAALGGGVGALSAAPLGVPGKTLRLRWPGGYQTRLRRPGNAVPSKTTHPLNIIDLIGYGPQRYGGKGPSGGGHGSSDGPRLGANAAASFSTISHDCKTSLARISTCPKLRMWIGRRDCVWCACVSCPHGRTVWLSTSPP